MSENLTQEQYREQIGTTFTLVVDSENIIPLELQECRDKSRHDGQEEFSLLFAGPPDPYLAQMIYTLRHEALGELGLFLVPVKKDADHFYYEAYFNRFRTKDGQ